MSGGKKKTVEQNTLQITPTMDPIARDIVAGIVGQASPFMGGGENSVQSLLAPAFQTPDSFINAMGQTNATIGGDYFGQDPGVTGYNDKMGAVRAAIEDSAKRAVGDEFSIAGRTGSPAQQVTLAKTIANALAPYEYGAAESQLGRSSSAYQNERQRQLTAAFQSQGQFDPISQFQRFVTPLLDAAGLFPTNVLQEGQGSSRSSGWSWSLGDLIGN